LGVDRWSFVVCRWALGHAELRRSIGAGKPFIIKCIKPLRQAQGDGGMVMLSSVEALVRYGRYGFQYFFALILKKQS